MPDPADKTTTKPPKQPAQATKPKAGKGQAAKPKAARHGNRQYDWTSLRREFIRGDDLLTLKAMSAKEGYPAYDTLKTRAAAEDWSDLRTEFRHQVDTKLRELDLDMKTEVRSTLGKLGQALISIGMKGAATIQPDKLEPIDVARFVKIGADLKVKAAGMDEVKVRLGRIKSAADLEKLSDDDLWLLAGMVPPGEEEDDEF
ncbi:hypothetical protein [Deinococcus wulumuqiensis]|uniref:Terminase small subunit n=1 Tax=Deinococcus wulumuqiensis TaxID=980427 RepID=A0AAV4K1G2_9DEIO|nr:hypothetical protein [Deinococcus wulumuqiensis]QII20205.1 hypothetical protein G6R31_05040 [Deinococcus wulumuqiensis R12]GGI75207.1 hypothetical protein GCM10010914_06780 [Deinococcus wulumuqiensis]GGP28694.1 hypothetical protein GCM10008021_03450 [Deinococcus wulumuqiensis]